MGNTLFHDRPAAWPMAYARAEAALLKSLRADGVGVALESLYGNADTFLGYYYALRGDGMEEPGTFAVLSSLLQKGGETVESDVVGRALRAMYAQTQRNWHPDRNARTVLAKLQARGHRLGAVSNGSDDANALELLQRSRLDRWIDFLITSAAYGKRKPDAGIFRAALKHFAVEPAQATMVGDSYSADIVGAHDVGMSTIWVTGRTMQPVVPGTAQPTAIVSSIRAIPALIG